MTDRIGGLVERLAELAVAAGANVQPGQVVAVGSEPGKEPLSRAVADAAYRHRARFVDVTSFDLWVKRSRVLHSSEEDLDYVPPWYGQRLRALGELNAARIGLTGPVAPNLFDGLDPTRLARDRLPFIPEAVELVNKALTNWTAIPCPTPAWAAVVHGDAPDALERLWDDIAVVCRLDEDDPVAAWRERAERLVAMAARLNDVRLRELRFRGPGTDLSVGLLEGSRWLGGNMQTSFGLTHIPNLPTEEVFTAPDPTRVSGEVRSTKPLVIGGSTVRGLRVRFEDGRAVEVAADEGGDVLKAMTARDEGAARLGEVALVDRESRVGQLGRVFYDTLLDENAASHVALGAAYTATATEDEGERINDSQIHIDFMIGGDDVEVTGVTADGTSVGLLHRGVWQLP
jgi:aminopeptidase